jgi:hypothetical protein
MKAAGYAHGYYDLVSLSTGVQVAARQDETAKFVHEAISFVEGGSRGYAIHGAYSSELTYAGEEGSAYAVSVNFVGQDHDYEGTYTGGRFTAQTKGASLTMQYTDDDGTQGTAVFAIQENGSRLFGSWRTADGAQEGTWIIHRPAKERELSWLERLFD